MTKGVERNVYGGWDGGMEKEKYRGWNRGGGRSRENSHRSIFTY